MEGLVELHDNIMFYLVIILFGVGWILLSIARNYVHSKSPISHKYLNHGTLIELIWTITPTLILIFIAFPSFKLLYLMDEVTDSSITTLIEGDPLYWSYQYPDLLNSYDDLLDSYDDLYSGIFHTDELNNNNLPPIRSGFSAEVLGIYPDSFKQDIYYKLTVQLTHNIAESHRYSIYSWKFPNNYIHLSQN